MDIFKGDQGVCGTANGVKRVLPNAGKAFRPMRNDYYLWDMELWGPTLGHLAIRGIFAPMWPLRGHLDRVISIFFASSLNLRGV